MRKEPFLQAGDEDGVELEPLRRVHRHQLQRGAPFGGLSFSRLQRGVGEEGDQRTAGLGRTGQLQIGLAHEALRGVDELAQILDAVLPILFRAVVRQQLTRVDHVLDRLRQRQAGGGHAHRLDLLDERRHARARLAADVGGARGLPQAGAGVTSALLQGLERARADAARREIDDAQERPVVARARRAGADTPSACLISVALEEAHAAVDAVGHAGVEQRVLEHTRLRIGAIEQGDLVRRHAIVDEAP